MANQHPQELDASGGVGHRPSRLREMSVQLIVDEVAASGSVSQSDLVRVTGLSRATVASVVTDLVTEGRLVLSAGPETVGRGRPPRLLSLGTAAGYVVAIDFGHAHLAVAIADRAGVLLHEENQVLDVDGSSTEVLQTAVDTIRRNAAALPTCQGRPAAVVMGVPGPIDIESGRLRSGTLLPGWVGSNPAEELGRLVGQRVWVENDANLGALGEMAYGAAQGVRDFLYVKVSSGIGAGVVVDGRIYRGSRGTAGEIGHVQVRDDGALCRCGSRGCLETLSSADSALGFLRQAHGEGLTFDDAMAIVRSADPGAVRLFNDMGMAIGKVVAAVCSNLDPQVIVVGGKMVDAEGPLLEGISTAVRRYTQPYVSSQLAVVAGTLGARAGLLGAVAEAVRHAHVR
ncbi:ROK family protein [Nakamurella silvestris]|nr:ROK family protein [Nakamurella silvestris]